jgi:hypothetical protein
MPNQKSDEIIISARAKDIHEACGEWGYLNVAISKYDRNYEIGEIDNLVVNESGYSSFNVDKLNKKLEIEMKYGKLEVDEVAEDFENIDLKIQYGHANIDIDPGASYNLKAEAKYGSIDHPDSDNLSKIIVQSESSISGLIGSNKNTKSKVTIYSRYGKIDLD